MCCVCSYGVKGWCVGGGISWKGRQFELAEEMVERERKGEREEEEERERERGRGRERGRKRRR